MRHVRRLLVLTALLAIVPATPATAAPAPVLHISFKARGIPAGTPLRDGHRTFDVAYRTLIFASATLTDPTTGAPLAGVPVRVTGDLAVKKPEAPTSAGGSALLRLRPRVTTAYAFDVPSSAGTVVQRVTFRVVPDWKVAAKFPVRRGKIVVSGRLLAGRSATARGSYVKLQRRTGKRWVTVKRLALSGTLVVSARLSRSFEGRKLRFVYISKTDDYIGSSRAFNVRVAKPASDASAGDGTTNVGGSADLGGSGDGGLIGGGNGSGGSCAGPDC